MWRSKWSPTLVVTLLRWADDVTFVGLYKGQEILCHKDHWEEIK